MMDKPNIDIEVAIVSAGLRKYQIADKLGITDGNFSRKLRKELTKCEKQKIFQAIKELKEV